jgi:hypothetical protein
MSERSKELIVCSGIAPAKVRILLSFFDHVNKIIILCIRRNRSEEEFCFAC